MFGWEDQILGRDRQKSRVQNRKLSFFQRNQGQLSQFCPGRIEALLLHILDPKLSFILFKLSQKMSKKPIILTFFQHFPKFAPLPLLNFGVDPTFDHPPMCILLKLDYVKFGVSNLFFSKVIEEKPLVVGLTPW